MSSKKVGKVWLKNTVAINNQVGGILSSLIFSCEMMMHGLMIFSQYHVDFSCLWINGHTCFASDGNKSILQVVLIKVYGLCGIISIY